MVVRESRRNHSTLTFKEMMATSLEPLSKDIGFDGDFYCDRKTDDVYKRVHGNWIFVRNVPGISSLVDSAAKLGRVPESYQLSLMNVYMDKD